MFLWLPGGFDHKPVVISYDFMINELSAIGQAYLSEP
jgi:hypothetical protein